MATKITIRKNGPVLVEGGITIVDPQGNEYGLGGKTMTAFCRCGASQKKPFCDGSHNSCGFEHEPVAFDVALKQ